MNVLTKELIGFLTEEECKKIIEEFDENLERGRVYEGFNSRRISEIKFISLPEIENKILKKVNELISLKNFHVVKNEDVQFTKYSVGEHYDWHFDTPPEILSESQLDQRHENIKKRTYSVTIQLNENYQGGEFLYEEFNTNDIKKISKKTGTFFIFNSSIKHKVDKVTEGVRYSLVMWLILEKTSDTKTLI